jgi:hypothetical protein
MIEILYDNADDFIKSVKDAGSDASKKDAPRILHLGFLEGDKWHKLHLKYCKGRKDVAEALKTLKDEVEE